jgi:hypothetical protein
MNLLKLASQARDHDVSSYEIKAFFCLVLAPPGGMQIALCIEPRKPVANPRFVGHNI